MDPERWQSLADWRSEDLTAQRRRLAIVPMEERLLEAIAWSATLLADDLRRGPASGRRCERTFPTGLGSLRS